MEIKSIFCIRLLLLLFVFSWGKVLLFSQRIITLAPALTEIVFSLGKGDKIVGNTRFCDYPEKAKKIVHIGGIVDLNLESIVTLQPDIIFLYPEIQHRLAFLNSKVKLVVVPHETLDDLFLSIEIISRELDTKNKGQRLILEMKDELKRSSRVFFKKKQCLIIVGRNANDFRNMHILGKRNFLNEILDICGGKNAYRGNIAYPLVSLESVLSLNPDYIFEISAFYEGIEHNLLLGLWQKYNMITAVKNGHLFFIKDTAWLRPGPRIGVIAQQMSQMLGHD